MKPRTIILLVVAVVCGLAAMYLTNRLLADKGTPPPVATMKVLVSKQKVSAYVPIKKPEDLFEVKEVPEGTYSPKCITDLKALQGKALRQPLNEQMPVTPDDLLNETTSGLIGLLHEGQRAVAIRVTPESLVGGFVLPGSKVDVMFVKKRGDGDSETQIFLQNMLVLAVDMNKTREADKDTMMGTTATLAATPEEAEQLSLAQALGDLRLLLRTPLDGEGDLKYKPVTLTDLAHRLHTEDPTKPGGTDTDPAAGGTNGTGLPTLPKVATQTPTTPTPPAPVVEKVADKTPPPPKTFTMKIKTGETVTWAVFKWDNLNNCWEGDEADHQADDAPKSKDAAKPEDAPKPQKAPVDKQEKETPVG
jgi:pilus assembly protein CpaB